MQRRRFIVYHAPSHKVCTVYKYNVLELSVRKRTFYPIRLIPAFSVIC